MASSPPARPRPLLPAAPAVSHAGVANLAASGAAVRLRGLGFLGEDATPSARLGAPCASAAWAAATAVKCAPGQVGESPSDSRCSLGGVKGRDGCDTASQYTILQVEWGM